MSREILTAKGASDQQSRPGHHGQCILLISGLSMLGYLVDITRPYLQDTDGIAVCLGLRSAWVVAHQLQK